MGFSLSNLLRQGVAQVNPFDGGKTAATVRQQQKAPAAQLPAQGQPGFGVVAPQRQIVQQQQQPQMQRPAPSIIHQVTHNPVSNFVGGMAKPLIQAGIAIPHDIGNAEVGIAHALGKAQNVHTQTGQQFVNQSIGKNVNKAVGYTGTARQQALDALNNATWLLPGAGKAIGNLAERSGVQVAEHSAPVIGKTLSNAAGKVTTKLVNYGGHAQVGGTMMATQAGAQEALNNPHANAGTIFNAAKSSYVPGLFLGAAAPVIHDAAPQVVPAAKAFDRTLKTAQSKATTNASIDAGINDISKQQKLIQQRINKAPLNATRGTESLQQHIQVLEGQKAQLNAARPQMSRTEKVLAIQPGGSMKPVRPTKTYQTIHAGGEIKPVQGEPVQLIKGVDTFIHQGTGGHVVSESSTGRHIGTGTTKEQAIAAAKANIQSVGEPKFKQMLAENQLPKPTAPVKPTTPEVPFNKMSPELQAATKELWGAESPAELARGQAKIDSIKNGTAASTKPAEALPKPSGKPQLPASTGTGGVSSANGTKVRGLTKGIQNSSEFSPELQSKVSSKYTPFTDKAATQSTGEFMKQPLDDAHTQVLQALAQGHGTHVPGAAGNIGVKFGKQEVSNAGAVMKALDQAGRHDEAQIIHDQLAQKLTNAGQTAQATKLIYNRTPEGLQNMARKALTDAKVKISPKLQKQMDAGLAKIKATKDGTPANDLARKQYDRLVGTHIPTTTGTKALSLYKTGILSSPKTAVKVFGAGLPNMALENAADAVAAPIDKVVSLFNHGHREVTAPSIGSMKAGAKALPKALTDAKIRFKDDVAMPGSTGLGNSELSGTNAKPHGANFGIAKDGGRTKLDKLTGGASSKFLNGYTSSIGRVHGAFQTIPYEVRAAQSLAQSAKAEALNRGLKGAEQTNFIHDFTAHPENYGKAGKKALATADESAQYATSQQKTALGSAASSIQHTMPGGQVIAPITRIPGAVATQVVNYSPAGVLKTVGKAMLDKKAGEAFDQQGFSRGLGRSVVGTGLMAGGAALALQGRVSGAYPTDKATQQLWTSANIPANSVYVGGKAYPNEPWKNSGGTWQQISSPGGAGAQAGLTGGSVVDGYKKGGVGNAIVGGTQGAAQIITNQPYLTGISGAMGAINTPTQAKSFLDQTAGSVVPGVVRDVATSTDSLQRQTSVQGIGQSIKNSVTNGIPVIREHNQPQVDVMGNELQRNNGVLNAALNPLNPQKSNPSALTNAMGAIHNSTDINGKPLTIPTQIAKKYTIKDATGKTTPLTDAQRTQFIKQSGQGAQAEMNAQINSPTFKNATPEQQSKQLADIMSGARDVTKQQFGNAAKLTSAGKAYAAGQAPQIGTNGKVTTSGASNLNPKIDKQSAATLNKYANMSATDRKKAQYSDPKFDYNYAQAKYNNDVLNNSLSTAQKIQAADSLAKEKVGADYSKDVRDLYGLSKAQLANYLTTQEPGVDKQKLGDQLQQYDQALYDAGLSSTLKYKTGVITNADGTLASTRSSGSSSSGKVSKTTADAYNLYSGNANSLKYQKSLRSIIENASMGKGKGTSKSVTIKAKGLKTYKVAKQGSLKAKKVA